MRIYEGGRKNNVGRNYEI